MIYRVHQRSIFWAHVDRLYCDASVLEDPLCAQQEPCPVVSMPIQRGAVDLYVARAGHIKATQCGVQAPRFTYGPRPAYGKPKRAALMHHIVPCTFLI